MIPVTTNQAWGFWGTMGGQASVAWPIAITRIASVTQQPGEFVQLFLDSRHGRHFADTVQDGLAKGQRLEDAIDAAIQQWMDWTIDQDTHRQYGIPRGFPHLTGFVLYCAAFMSEMPPPAEDPSDQRPH
jgi:hypothetical protein